MPTTPTTPPIDIRNESSDTKVPRGRYRPTSNATAGVQPETTEMQGVSFRDLLEILFRRWRWMVLTLLVVLGVGVLMTVISVRKYAATTEVTVRQANPYDRQSDSIPSLSKFEDLSTNDIPTQLRLLRSYDFLNSVYTDNTLLPNEVRERGFHGFPSVSITNDSENNSDSNVISITVTAFTPEAAAKMANGIATKYQVRNLAENQEATITALKYVTKERDRISEELDAARNALAAFEAVHGVVGDKGKLAQYNEQLTKLAADDEEARRAVHLNAGLKRLLEQKLRSEDRTVITSVTENQNPVLDKIDDQLYDLETHRAELLMQFVPDSPEVKTVEGSIRTLRKSRVQYLNTRISSRAHTLNPLYQQLQQQYLTASTEAETAQVRDELLSQTIQQLRKDIVRLPVVETQGAKLKARVAELEQTETLLSQNYQLLNITKESHVSDVKVLTTAQEEPTPVSPNIPRNLILAFLLGLMLAVSVAALLEALDDRVHNQSFIERTSKRPILAHIPKIPEGDSPQLTHGDYSRSPILEGMRLLRSNLAFTALDASQQIIAVTSPGPGEGKTTTAINLAAVLALDGKRVVLVDADLRRPSLHQYFGAERKVGLTSVATGKTTLDEALSLTSIEGVTLLTTGPLPPNPPEVLNAKSTRQVFQELAARFDVVIIDTPPAAGLSDVPVISTLVDGIIIVVSADQTHRGQFLMALETLEGLGAPILGFIVNKIDAMHSTYKYYYYYRYSYYNYNYGEDGDGSTGARQKVRTRRRRSSSPPQDETGSSS